MLVFPNQQKDELNIRCLSIAATLSSNLAITSSFEASTASVCTFVCLLLLLTCTCTFSLDSGPRSVISSSLSFVSMCRWAVNEHMNIHSLISVPSCRLKSLRLDTVHACI